MEVHDGLKLLDQDGIALASVLEWIPFAAKAKGTHPNVRNSLADGFEKDMKIFTAKVLEGLPDRQFTKATLRKKDKEAGKSIGDVRDSWLPVDLVEWWKEHGTEMPTMDAIGSIMGLCQPSSAASERIFSLLTSLFTEEQRATLGDALEAACKLRYHYTSSGHGGRDEI